MTYINVKIGTYSFSVNPASMIARFLRRPGQLKILGRNMSVVESMGTEGLVMIRFVGHLIDSGTANKKADLTSLINEYRRNDPLFFQADMFSDKAARGWCFINELNPIEVGGRVQSYEYGLAVTVIGFSDEWSRASVYTAEPVPNDFVTSYDKIVPLPVNASGSSEQIGFYRKTVEGDIPLLQNPKLSYCKWDPLGYDDSWLMSGSLKYETSGTESLWDNGMIQFRTRQDESTWPGMVEVWIYTGSATLSLLGYLDVEVQQGNSVWSSGSDLTQIIVKSAPANKYENRYHTIAKLFYPVTTTGSTYFNLFVETWRGRPYAKLWIENATDGLTMTGCRYKFIINTGSWSTFTAYRSGSSNVTLWAQSGSYGTIRGSGANDSGVSGSLTWLSTDYPLASSSYMAGFIRPIKDTFFHVAKDVGNYWSETWAEYTGSSISYGSFFPEVFFFAEGYGLQGSRSEVDLVREAFNHIQIVEDVIQQAP